MVRIIMIQETKWTIVNCQAKNTHIIRVEHPVGRKLIKNMKFMNIAFNEGEHGYIDRQ